MSLDFKLLLPTLFLFFLVSISGWGTSEESEKCREILAKRYVEIAPKLYISDVRIKILETPPHPLFLASVKFLLNDAYAFHRFGIWKDEKTGKPYLRPPLSDWGVQAPVVSAEPVVWDAIEQALLAEFSHQTIGAPLLDTKNTAYGAPAMLTHLTSRIVGRGRGDSFFAQATLNGVINLERIHISVQNDHYERVSPPFVSKPDPNNPEGKKRCSNHYFPMATCSKEAFRSVHVDLIRHPPRTVQLGGGIFITNVFFPISPRSVPSRDFLRYADVEINGRFVVRNFALFRGRTGQFGVALPKLISENPSFTADPVLLSLIRKEIVDRYRYITEGIALPFTNLVEESELERPFALEARYLPALNNDKGLIGYASYKLNGLLDLRGMALRTNWERGHRLQMPFFLDPVTNRRIDLFEIYDPDFYQQLLDAAQRGHEDFHRRFDPLD